MSGLRILLSGMIAGVPGQGGATWAVLQYLLGLRKLGHEVWFVEPIQHGSIIPPGADLAHSDNARYLAGIRHDFGLHNCLTLLVEGTRQSNEIPYEELEKLAGKCDLLLNISGMLQDPNLTQRIPVRVYLDLDPGFTQLWHEVEGIDLGFEGHTHFVTIGPLIGEPECKIPNSFPWLKTLPPIQLDWWPPAPPVDAGAYSTVGHWRGYGSIHWNGLHYGQRAHSFRRYLDLPSRTDVNFLMALAIHPEEKQDLEALAAHRWTLIDPSLVASNTRSYKEFIRCSRAELGIAKSGYAVSRSGWFSDRSICYLASGRPVIAQETGFSRLLPTGEGLFAFSSQQEILASIDAVEADYEFHSNRAAEIAREYFDSDKVLPKLLSSLGVQP